MGPLPPTEWFDPSRKGKIDFPEWRLFYEYFISVKSSPLSANQKLSCYLFLGSWLASNWIKLVRDLLIAAEQSLRNNFKSSNQTGEMRKKMKKEAV
jgi:hypothetical protein